MSGQEYPFVIKHTFATPGEPGPYQFFVDVWPGSACNTEWNNLHVGMPQDSTGASTVVVVR